MKEVSDIEFRLLMLEKNVLALMRAFNKMDDPLSSAAMTSSARGVGAYADMVTNCYHDGSKLRCDNCAVHRFEPFVHQNGTPVAGRTTPPTATELGLECGHALPYACSTTHGSCATSAWASDPEFREYREACARMRECESARKR